MIKRVPKPEIAAAYPDAPAYFLRALSYLGTKELIDGNLNPLIEAWLVNHTRFPPELINPRTQWCAAAISAMLEQTGVKSTHSAAAASYIGYGRSVPVGTLYSILVLRRGKDAYHVAFDAGQAADQVLALGGNQGNELCIKLYPSSSVVAARVPAG